MVGERWTPRPTAERPLAGLRVLDLSRYLPGPLATLRLVELGAEVVKLEPPQGDPARVQPPFEPDGTSTLHGYLNRGKRSLVLGPAPGRRPRAPPARWCGEATCWWSRSGPASWRASASTPRSCGPSTPGS